MILINQYQILEVYFPRESLNKETWSFWTKTISTLLFQLSKGPMSIFTVNPDKSRSIGYELGIATEGKLHSKKYLNSILNPVIQQDLDLLVDTDEFYLGHTILVNSDLNESKIENIIICWSHNLFKSEVEFFKMDSDGLCFYWYNPKNIEEAKRYLTGLQWPI
ncbi:MAG TPA: hypothetical protein PKM27_15010 [Saprospiraceae bacterium]|nr:hypothetical protein [Saprospiraceae bacterium]HNT20843.1 hypothetical protein [Saprospiraceae bacterium]